MGRDEGVTACTNHRPGTTASRRGKGLHESNLQPGVRARKGFYCEALCLLSCKGGSSAGCGARPVQALLCQRTGVFHFTARFTLNAETLPLYKNQVRHPQLAPMYSGQVIAAQGPIANPDTGSILTP